jgi:hypothetical protein
LCHELRQGQRFDKPLKMRNSERVSRVVRWFWRFIIGVGQNPSGNFSSQYAWDGLDLQNFLEIAPAFEGFCMAIQ